MAKFWRTQAFQALSSEWDRRLRDSGFKDEEKTENGERYLKSYCSIDWTKFRNKKKEEFLAYCQMLTELIAKEEHFDDDLDRLIMERTAEGCTIRQISDEIKAMLPQDRKRSKFDRHTISYVRRRYENRWGIRIWKPEDMVSRKVIK